jgi:hypothetical protein
VFTSVTEFVIHCWRTGEGDQRGGGGEWEPIKIPRGNSAYIPKSTQRPSLLTRSRPHSYSRATVIVGWVPIFQEVWLSRLVEISTLMMKALNNVGSNPCSHYTMAPLVTNPCTHELASLRRLCHCKWIKNTSKNRKEQSRIADEWLAHESWGLTECRWNYSWQINLSKTYIKWRRLLNIKGLGSRPNPRTHP